MKTNLTILYTVVFMFSCTSPAKKTSHNNLTVTILDTLNSNENTNLSVTKDFLLGKFDFKTDSTFSKINPPYTSKAIYLKTEVIGAFMALYEAAKADGVVLKIVSGTRNFKAQKIIWERKWKKYENLEPYHRALKILEYSAMPSSSRHHWGTDIDLNSLNNSYFHSGKGLETHKWLKTYANDFGFYQVYTEKGVYRAGYNEEKWHWSYMPLASQYLQFYNANIDTKDFKGFKGSNLAGRLEVIENYVNGISEKAKNYEKKRFPFHGK